MANCDGITISLGDVTNPCTSPVITHTISTSGVDSITVDGGAAITVDWATVITSFTGVTGCISDTATVMVNDAGTIKKATVRQLANSNKNISGGSITVTDETNVFSTGGTITLPSTGLCQDVSISITPCSTATTITAGGTTLIQNRTGYLMNSGAYNTLVLRWDGTNYIIISEHYQETLTSFVIPVKAAATQSIRVGYREGGTYNINWGDGVTTTGLTNNTASTHTYSPAFTGNIIVTTTLCTITPFTIVFSTSATNNTSVLNLSSIPTTTTYFESRGTNTSGGNIAMLPSGLLTFILQGSNITTGDISQLPRKMLTYSNAGANTTFGNIGGLPSTLLGYDNSGNNTSSGSIANLPMGLTFYSNWGTNTTSGNISTLPTTLVTFINRGSNTTTGDIANIPASITNYSNYGSNTTSGSIANLKVGLLTYANQGVNTTTGSVASLPSTLLVYSNQGNNTTSGSIVSLPAGLTSFVNEGTNTTSGNISGLPIGLTTYINIGSNTTTGNINTLPAGIVYYENRGLNTVNTYTAGRTWAASMGRFIHLPASGSGLTSAMVDALLIDLAATTWIAASTITLSGNNQARTAASAAAVTSLQGQGVTVTTN